MERQAKKTDSAFDAMGKKVGVTGATLKQGLVALSSVALGAGLVSGVQKIVTGYNDAAKAADDLAGASGSSIETISGMQAALTDAGISADKSAALLTKFTTVVSGPKGVAALKAMNVELVKGADGSIDYAASMVKAVDAIMGIGDAAERNRQLVALFGKSAAKDFQDLINSGMSLSEAINQIDTSRILTDEDAARAQAFDAMMDSLQASAQTLATVLGRALTPAVTTFGNAITPLVGLLGGIPPSVYLVVGSVTALNVAMKSTFVTGGLAAAGTAVRGFLATMVALRTGMITTSTVVVGAMDAMTAALAANPFILLAAGIAAVVTSVGAYNDSLDDAIAKTGGLTDATARMAVENRSIWESLGAAIKDTFSWEGLKQNLSWGGPSKQDLVDSTQGALEAKAATADYADTLKDVKTVAADATQSLIGLGSAAKGLNSDFINAEDAADRAKAALSGWNDALKTGKGLDDDRQASLRQAVQTQADYIDKLVESGASAATVKKANDKWVESLYASAKAAGVSKDDVDAYLKKLGFIPSEVETKFIADTLSATTDVKALKKQVEGLPDSVDIPVYIKAIIQNPGAFAKVERLVGETFMVDVPITVPAPRTATSSMGVYLTPTGMAAAPVVNNITQTFSIDVSGAGSPATTAREVDRVIRRAGDPRLVSVTG